MCPIESKVINILYRQFKGNTTMNYKKIYDQLISKGQTRLLEGYSERHHIIPRCMSGSDELSNLVALTPEEHYVAHQLLVKIYPTNHKLVYAARMMGSCRQNNKEYGWIRRKIVGMMTGVPRTLESVTKQRETIKYQYENGRISNMLGNILTDKHKQAISAANTNKTVEVKSRSSLEGYTIRYGEMDGKKLYEKDCLKKDSSSLAFYIRKFGEEDGLIAYKLRGEQKSKIRSELNIGYTHSDESKQKISISKIGKKLIRTDEHNLKIGAANKGKIMPKLTCSHCGLIGSANNIRRWHNDNCKYKTYKEM